ncbi:hypothetical protein B0J14DRAFT_654684 [Halenospora varia]|nr:hypothetical protein B0J14DRAFT_654684 [Halenospora varia]
MQTHRTILDVIRLLTSSIPGGNLEEIRNFLRQKLLPHEFENADEILEGSINFAARLLIMVPAWGMISMGRSLIVTGETKLDWKDGPIRQLVLHHFDHQVQMTEKVKFEKLFNARNLERVGGIKIRWTSNLADHLRMREDDRTVELFHYVSFLDLHKNSIFPLCLIKETINTLALLLPEHDRHLKQWFEKEQLRIQKRGLLRLDPRARQCGQLKASERKIEKFRYYHDRLVILKQVFDEAEPSNIKQWWHDRRKKVQWYTFWVAVLILGLTVVFGIIQSVEGAMQVNLAMKANH